MKSIGKAILDFPIVLALGSAVLGGCGSGGSGESGPATLSDTPATNGVSSSSPAVGSVNNPSSSTAGGGTTSVTKYEALKFKKEPMCLYEGQTRSNAVIGKSKDAFLNTVETNVSGVTVLSAESGGKVLTVSHSDDQLSLKGVAQGITSISARFNDLTSELHVGVLRNGTVLPVVLQRQISGGCEAILAVEQRSGVITACGFARSTGGAATVSVQEHAIRITKCVLENPRNLPVIKIN